MRWNRLMLAVAIVVIDVVAVFIPITALLAAYLILFRPMWFKQVVDDLYRDRLSDQREEEAAPAGTHLWPIPVVSEGRPRLAGSPSKHGHPAGDTQPAVVSIPNSTLQKRKHKRPPHAPNRPQQADEACPLGPFPYGSLRQGFQRRASRGQLLAFLYVITYN